VIPRSAAATRRAFGALALLGLAGAGLLGVSGCSGDGDDELAVEEYCEQIVEVQPFDDQLGQIETLRLEEAYADLRDLSETAPTTIRPALETLAGYVGEAVEQLADVESGDAEAAGEALGGVLMSADEFAEVEAAGQEVERFTSDQCGFDLRSGSTVPTTEAPPTTAPPETAPADTAPPTTG
jgi:hypothetical protein